VDNTDTSLSPAAVTEAPAGMTLLRARSLAEALRLVDLAAGP